MNTRMNTSFFAFLTLLALTSAFTISQPVVTEPESTEPVAAPVVIEPVVVEPTEPVDETPDEPTTAEGKVAREAWEDNPLIADLPAAFFRDLRSLRQEVKTRKCPVNLCFAIQGDNFVNEEDFIAQKNFIELVVAITTTDAPGNFCAVQYGRTTSPISKLIGKKIKFLNKVQRANQVGGYETNIASALAYAQFQLRPRLDDPRKIILFGDGLDTVGEDPINVAKDLRKEGTELCAVQVGDIENSRALRQITGSRNRVLKIRQYLDVGEIIIAIVHDICSYFD